MPITKDTLAGLPAELISGKGTIDLIRDWSTIRSLRSGDSLGHQGQPCRYLHIVLSGILRIYQPGFSGREITLYRVRAGESCPLSYVSVLSEGAFPAISMAHEDCTVLLIQDKLVRTLIERHSQWRDFLNKALHRKICVILSTIDSALFKPLESRVAEYLYRNSTEANPTVHSTHIQIANEIGSSRVAISRIVSQLQARKILDLQRGKIQVIDRMRLKATSEQEILTDI